MARRTGGWQRVGAVAPQGEALSARRRGELALLAAWQRVAGQPLASQVQPSLEQKLLVLELTASDWSRAVTEVARRLALGVAALVEEGGVEAYVVRDGDGSELQRGKLSPAAIARAAARLRRSAIAAGSAGRSERAPLIAEPALSADERGARLVALRERYLARSDEP